VVKHYRHYDSLRTFDLATTRTGAVNLTVLLTAMAEHALALLAWTEVWGFPNVKRIQESGKQFKAVTATLLYYLILESQKFGGEVLNQFWYQLGECDENLKQNSESNF